MLIEKYIFYDIINKKMTVVWKRKKNSNLTNTRYIQTYEKGFDTLDDANRYLIKLK